MTPPPRLPTAPASDEPEFASRVRDDPSQLADPPVVLAVITGPHGVTGEVRLKLFTDDLTPYRSFNGGALTLKSLRVGGAAPIARFAGISDRTAAERMRGVELTVPRSVLPPLEDGEYYHADLIGLPCESELGEPLGRVAAVENFGAGDILEVERPGGERFMVPIAAAAIGERVVLEAAFVE